MNKVLVPKVTFKDIVADEKRIKMAYSRIFEIARRNILAKRCLTNGLSQDYTKIHHEETIFDDRGGGRNDAS